MRGSSPDRWPSLGGHAQTLGTKTSHAGASDRGKYPAICMGEKKNNKTIIKIIYEYYKHINLFSGHMFASQGDNA